jgi:class 3 adenylate cyclase
VVAALETLEILRAYNQGRDNPDFHIRLSGVGIDIGRDIWQHLKEGKFYGPTVDSAFHLGEDVCEGGEVLVTDRVWNRIKDDPLFAPVQAELDLSEQGQMGIEGFYHLRGLPSERKMPQPLPIQGPDISHISLYLIISLDGS